VTFELGARTVARALIRVSARLDHDLAVTSNLRRPERDGDADGFETFAADRPLAGGGLADQPFPIVAQRLGSKLGDRQRHDSLEADRAGR
jgi:hypothetical protein